ncbi:flagellar motor protein MotB [Priestia abyssalis]|uniref:flagellar motor protein MotB n=1 Tax=Priestia abyssalis TaxID=1221450 RepID=UPI00099598C1|nr:flagellar motor protein MotB [Priestia abyssalis]
MKKKHQHNNHEEHVDESWLIPYADLLTLLLALFIVLFSMSSIDAVKFKQLASTLNSSFEGGTGVLEYPSTLPPEQSPSLSKEEDNKEESSNSEKKSLQELQQKVNEYIKSRDLTGQLKTSLTDEGLLITILDNVLFDSGVAEVRPANRQLAKEISQLLVMETPKNVIISGHTDNIPIRNQYFESNWDLSVMRAVNFMKALLENQKLDPALFSAKGYGEYKPIASNSTEQGRLKNRRVEILIVPNEEITEQ